ncbi:MAG: HlyD family efflux transporter periplasmic adaptor subunit [Bacteroidota bacterium]
MNKGCLISLGLVLLVATLGLAFYFSSESSGDEKGETTKPKIEDIIKKTVATGSIKPRQEVMVKPQVSGVIDELFVEEGQMVKKGDKLARIKLVPSEVNINNARSGVELARIRVDEAERELERQKEVYKQRLDIAQARINFADAEKEETRQKQLYEDGVISEIDYNAFKVGVQLRKAELDNAQIVAQNTIKQFETSLDVRKQELAAAINNLQLLREGATRNSGQVANVVMSTLDGMILELPVEEGGSVIERNNFNEGTSIAVVADMSNLIFEGMVDESDVGKLREGMSLELTVGAIEKVKIQAKLEFIAPKGTKEEGAVKFKVRAAIQPEKDIFLRAGYSANGDIILDRREQVVALKERDVIFSGDTSFVQLRVSEDKFEKRQVKLGLSDGIHIEVLGGLDTTSVIKVIKGQSKGG